MLMLMAQEDDVLKRNVDQPTLEDHFDKAALPKVMQVRCGLGSQEMPRFSGDADAGRSKTLERRVERSTRI